jgi:RNase H-fold protein (predicted Holliday junction resolvase)
MRKKAMCIDRESMVVAVDPGREKCGYALVCSVDTEPWSSTLESGIVPTPEIAQTVARLVAANPSVTNVAIGNGTNSAAVVNVVTESCPNIVIVTIDERGTSEAARSILATRGPSTGLRRLLPKGLRAPDRPYDDVVAELIAQKFLASKQKNL